MGDKQKKEEVKRMAEPGERQDWVDDRGGEGDMLRKKAADARTVLDAAVSRSDAREAPRTVPLATLLRRTPSVDATGDVAPSILPKPLSLFPEEMKVKAEYEAMLKSGRAKKGQ